MGNSDLKLSVCIDAVLPDRSVDEALQIVAECDIPAFEFWAWWEKDLNEIKAARDRYGLSIAACCTKFISLVNPADRTDYLAGLADSIRAAEILDCPTLISQVGDTMIGRPRSQQHESLVAGLRLAAPMLEVANLTLMIEPLNEKVDHPGYYLISSNEAFEIIDEVNSPHVKVVFDIYHQQISEGNLIPNITTSIDKIGHFHAAGHPGRHELSVGEIHYPDILKSIAATNYAGFIGLEYWPQQDASQGLREVAKWLHDRIQPKPA